MGVAGCLLLLLLSLLLHGANKWGTMCLLEICECRPSLQAQLINAMPCRQSDTNWWMDWQAVTGRGGRVGCDGGGEQSIEAWWHIDRQVGPLDLWTHATRPMQANPCYPCYPCYDVVSAQVVSQGPPKEERSRPHHHRHHPHLAA